VGGTWVDGTGTQIGMVTATANACAGAEAGGAWTYTVSVSKKGKKVTLSDGTVGVVEGSAPARTITWSNGITYTEQADAMGSTESTPEQCKSTCDVGGTWVDGNGAQVEFVTDSASHPCSGAESGGAWTYAVTVGVTGKTITLSDGTVGRIQGIAPARTITWSNGITYTERQGSTSTCPSSCDVGGTWVDGTGTQIGMVTAGANPCAGEEAGGAWTYTVTVGPEGKKITLSDGTVGTVGGSAPARTITWSNGITYREETTESGPEQCKNRCDMSGTWVDGSGTAVGLVTDAANRCAGAHDGGAWTYTVTESASGTTITLSDGTVGTVGGSAPERVITFSNGITYTEQSDSTIRSCPSLCDVGGTWVDGTGAKAGLVTDAANPCAGAEESGAWTYTVTVGPEGKKITLSDGTVGTVGASGAARTITWSNGITYTEQK